MQYNKIIQLVTIKGKVEIILRGCHSKTEKCQNSRQCFCDAPLSHDLSEPPVNLSAEEREGSGVWELVVGWGSEERVAKSFNYKRTEQPLRRERTGRGAEGMAATEARNSIRWLQRNKRKTRAPVGGRRGRWIAKQRTP